MYHDTTDIRIPIILSEKNYFMLESLSESTGVNRSVFVNRAVEYWFRKTVHSKKSKIVLLCTALIFLFLCLLIFIILAAKDAPRLVF